MTDRERMDAPKPPHDVGDAYDPFRASDPPVLVHDAGLDTFEHAWEDREARCPQCRRGTADERGTAPLDGRRWVRFTCGDVIAVEHTAG
ncbi:MAG TPA: hypothetical protein VFN97_26125 [Actinospica sp.]|nr:hypothetical protein [Actinospica sp.]